MGDAYPHCTATIDVKGSIWVPYCKRCGWQSPKRCSTPIAAVAVARAEHGDAQCVMTDERRAQLKARARTAPKGTKR